MFTSFANGVVVALIALPTLYVYASFGWWFPSLGILIGCAIGQEGWLRCGQAWRASSELYHYFLVFIIAAVAVWLGPMLFFTLGATLPAPGYDPEPEWSHGMFFACILPAVLYMIARGQAWVDLYG